jgi:hypothetical protein
LGVFFGLRCRHEPERYTRVAVRSNMEERDAVGANRPEAPGPLEEHCQAVRRVTAAGSRGACF